MAFCHQSCSCLYWLQWWRGLVLVPGHWSDRVRMDCDVSPLSRCHPWSHHKLVTDHSEWDVLGEGHHWSPVTGCADLLWSSLSWHHGYPSSDILSSLKRGVQTLHWAEQCPAMVLRILFTTYLLCANFYIFPICSNRDNSMRLGNVSCH